MIQTMLIDKLTLNLIMQRIYAYFVLEFDGVLIENSNQNYLTLLGVSINQSVNMGLV